MNDPKRMTEGGGDARDRMLLESASDDAPTPAARAAAMSALGLAAPPTSAPLPRAPVASKLVLTCIGIASLTAVITVGVVVGRSRTHLTPEPAAANAPGSVPPPSSSEEMVAAPVVPTQVTLVPRHRKRATLVERTPEIAPTMRTLEEEVALVDTAREAQKDHRPRDVLKLIARHEKEFPEGMLRSEAALLSIEALLQLDERDRAATLANRFLATHPNDPLTERVRALLETAQSE